MYKISKCTSFFFITQNFLKVLLFFFLTFYVAPDVTIWGNNCEGREKKKTDEVVLFSVTQG